MNVGAAQFTKLTWQMGAVGTLSFLMRDADGVERVSITAAQDSSIDAMFGATPKS